MFRYSITLDEQPLEFKDGEWKDLKNLEVDSLCNYALAPDGTPSLFTTKYLKSTGSYCGGFIYFNTGEDITVDDKDLYIDVEVYGAGDKMTLLYVNKDNPADRAEIPNSKAVKVKNGDWTTLTFHITDAAFNGVSNTGLADQKSDFRLQANSVDTYVKSVSVYNSSDFEELLDIKQNFELENTQDIELSFELPVIDGCQIQWTSSDDETIVIEDNIAIIIRDFVTKSATLTAKIAKDGYYVEKSFDITLAPMEKTAVAFGKAETEIEDGKATVTVEVTDANYYSKDIYLYAVASGSTATVYEAKDKNMLCVYFANNSINGILNKIAEDQNGITTYQIGDKYYELSTSLENKIKASKVQELDIGTGYVLKLNMFNEIVSFEKIETSDWKDAYCVGLAYPNSTTIDSKVQVNLVMVGGSVFKPYLTNKILFNGDSVKATSLVGSTYFEQNGTPLRQPVKVKINNNGEITAMEVPEDRTASTYGVDFGAFSYDKYLASGIYRGSNNYKTINNHVLTSSTIIVEDPHYNVDGEEGKTEGVVFYTMDLFPSEATLNDVRFYDLDEGLRPSVMVYKSKNITIQGTPFLVDSVMNFLNEEGEQIKRITGYSNGSFLTYDEIEAGVIPPNVKRGDVCKIALDGTKLAVIEKVMSLKDRKPYADITVINAKSAYVYSYLYSVTDTSMVVTSPDSYTDSKLIGSSIGSAKIVVYDIAADKMYLGSTKDLYTDFVPESDGNFNVTDSSTMVFLHRSYDRAGEIIVVKN